MKIIRSLVLILSLTFSFALMAKVILPGGGVTAPVGLVVATPPQFNLNDIKVIHGQCVIAKAGITGVNDENSPCRKLYGAPLGSTSSGSGTSGTLLNNAPVN